MLAASIGLIAFLALAGYALDRAFLETAENNLRTRLEDLEGAAPAVAAPAVATSSADVAGEPGAAVAHAPWWQRLWSWLRGDRAAAMPKRGKT